MNDSIWNKTLLSIKNIIDPLPFNTWFSNIEFIDIQDDFQNELEKFRCIIKCYKNVNKVSKKDCA